MTITARAALVALLTVCFAAIRLGRPAVGPVMQTFGVNGGYYARYHQRGHNGVDIRLPVGTPVSAAAAGVVVDVGYQADGYGRYVVVRHPGGYYTLYAHLSQIAVRYGQVVGAGRRVGLSGNSGNAPRPHLHFELRTPGAMLAGYPDGARDPSPFFVIVSPARAGKVEQ